MTKGKRTTRTTQAGNINGYVGGKYYRYLGETFCAQSEAFAEAWKNGETDLDASCWDEIRTETTKHEEPNQ